LATWQLHSVSDIASSEHATPTPLPTSNSSSPITQTETQREFDQARELQLNLMRHPPELAGFHIATYYDACTELSGDFNQFVHLPDGRLAFSQGDVSGHGLRAGMLMAMTNKLVDLFANQGLSPCQTVVQIHRAMVADLISGRSFITLTYAVLDPSTRTVNWVRAGHNPSLVWRAATGTIESLTPSGMAVGFPVQELFMKQLAEVSTALHPGDLFIVFTDGITEAMGPGDEQFGDERLSALISAHAGQGPAAVIDAIIAGVTAHLRGRAKQDDLSLIVIGVDI
jgi:sigma-B regulation protein RsbU (phosphoserine phosphatase)